MIGEIIGVLIFAVVGITISILGWLIWKKQKITLMHDYHVDKVSEENKAAFCKLSGIGLVLIGIGLLISAAILWFTSSPYSFFCFAACFVAGLVLLITAGIKYNR